MKKIFEAIDGKFGRNVLKSPYRFLWRMLTYSIIVILFFQYIMVPFYNWYDNVIAMMNFIIWK